MCGIAGFQGSGSERDLWAMISKIRYRGPDAAAVVLDAGTGLAHARLSIIDLSPEAGQPMTDPAGRATVVFNGEIYNFGELRVELASRHGCKFRTSSDTEVLLHAYLALGTAMLHRLNGMFAFAIHDHRTGELILARDRMGKKPLLYHEGREGFVFGSELKAVSAHPDVPFVLDVVALHQYLTFEYVPSPRSILSGVAKVGPGHFLRIRNGRIVEDAAYWSPSYAKRRMKPAEARHRFDAELAAATERRLVADVPLGVFLSGGIDSSAVAWYAQRASSSPVKTFSIGFEERSYDESSYAAEVARHLGTEHYEATLTRRDCLELVEPLFELLDEPFADPSVIPTHLLSRFARSHVTVCLGGDGSDELLAGYPTFVADRLRPLVGVLPERLVRGFRRASSVLPPSDANISLDFKVAQFLRGFELEPRHANTLWLGSFTPTEKAQLLHPDVRAELDGLHGVEPVDDLLTGRRLAALDEVIHVFLRTYLLDDILFKVDRASMYASLEVRAPFLDVNVVELANSLPDRMKRRRLDGKRVLKDAMRGRLPDRVIDRPKKGFGIPLSSWLRGELRPLCEEALSPSAIRAGGLFDPTHVERLVSEHMSGRRNHRKRLWTLLAFQLWLTGWTTRTGEMIPMSGKVAEND